MFPIVCFAPGSDAVEASDFTYEVIPAPSTSLDIGDMTIDSRGVMHVAYPEADILQWTYGNNEDGVWRFDSIPYLRPGGGLGCYFSIAVDSEYAAHVSYVLYPDDYPYGSDLVYATNSGGSWSSVIIEGSEGPNDWTGDASSLAIDAEGGIHIAYAGTLDTGSSDEYLKYATNLDGTWVIEFLDQVGEIYFESPSLALDSLGNAHISCLAVNQSDYYSVWNLTYVTNTGGNWTCTIVDEHAEWWETDIALDPQGFPSISYRQILQTGGLPPAGLGYAELREGLWETELIDAGYVELAYVSSLAFDTFGNAHIAYYGDDYYPWYATNEGGAWNTSELDSPYGCSWEMTIVVDSYNTVHVFYCNMGTDELIHAYRETLPPEPIAYRLEVSEVGEYPIVGVPQPLTVTVYDQFGEVFTDYLGTVHFDSNVTDAVSLPSNYKFEVSDRGTHTFSSGVEFITPGVYSISCSDTSDPRLFDQQTDIRAVLSAPVASAFVLEIPDEARIGASFSAELAVYNEFGGIHKGYSGTVSFSTSDSGAGVVLPPDYTFTPADAGKHTFLDAFSLVTLGSQTLTVQDVSSPSLQASGTVEVFNSSRAYRVYDMFEQPWGDWYQYRLDAYQNSVVLNDEPGAYTMVYNPDLRGRQGIIMAPYRWNVTAIGMATIDVNDPAVMPVFGPEVSGASANLDIYWEYLYQDWWDSYWLPTWSSNPGWTSGMDNMMDFQMYDGYYIGTVYEARMNRQAAETWLNMPQTADPFSWWAANGDDYIASWLDWIDYQGNVEFDIFPGYEWPYTDLGTLMDLEVEGDEVVLRIGHFNWGYEVLITRWMTDRDICTHEPYMEDFQLSAQFESDHGDVTYDAVAQYNLHAVKANQTESDAAWVWEPQNIDYVPWAGSDFNPWEDLTYTSWNSGDYLMGTEVPYDFTPAYFNLTTDMTLTVQLPLQEDVIAYRGLPTPYGSIEDLKNGDDSAYRAIQVNGPMYLGWHCYPQVSGAPDLSPLYDNGTKELFIDGAVAFEDYHHPTGELYHSAPWIEFNVAPGPSMPDSIEVVVADDPTRAGSENSVMVSVLDQYGAVYEGYSGTVSFSSSDEEAVLPPDYTFVPGIDAGTHEFSFSFGTTGEQSLTVTDTSDPALAGSSGPILVMPAEEQLGILRVVTSPLLPAMIYVDGEEMSRYQIDWMEIPVGTHTISYGDAIGYAKPPPVTVEIGPGSTVEVQGVFYPLGLLVVDTQPHLHGTIYVDGVPRNDGSLRCYVSPGVYTVSFGAVANYIPPSPMVVTVESGGTTALSGVYTYSPGSPGPDPMTYGYLRVRTSPELPATISVDGVWMNSWGLDWVKLAPGYHTVAFSEVPGYVTPEPVSVYVPQGGVGSTIGVYVERGELRIQTDPAVPTTIYLNGIARNAWGLWVDLDPGTYVATFSPVEGYITPDPITFVIAAGSSTYQVVVFEPDG